MKCLPFWPLLFSIASLVQSLQRATAFPHRGNPNELWAVLVQLYETDVLGTRNLHVLVQGSDVLFLLPVRSEKTKQKQE